MNRAIISDLIHIFNSSVYAVTPECLIRKSVFYNPLTKQLKVANQSYDLTSKDVYLVGTGKAVQNMANEIENILSSKIKQGIISIPKGSYNNKGSNCNVTYYEGAENNLPDENSVSTASKIKDLVLRLNDNDILLVLISGGGSALLPLPKNPITLEEKSELIKKLAYCGADIKELNTVRKKISEIKGGQLAIQAYPSTVITLILSDIIGDPIDLIASGPTCENTDEIHAALNIINKFNLYHDLPRSIKEVLNCDHILSSFPKNNVQNIIIGSNKLSIKAAIQEAKKLNYFPIDISNSVHGKVTEVANEYAKLVSILINLKNSELDRQTLIDEIEMLQIPGLKFYIDDINFVKLYKSNNICLIFGGETIVEVKGTGKGGRNQQLALEFSKIIYKLKDQFYNYEVYLLSAGTDGIDGPTDAAGAIGYYNLIEDSIVTNTDVNQYIDNNDSYNFYKNFVNGDLHVITGHTNTNVMDIHIIIIKKH